MKTFGDLFTGGGLACVGAIMAGYTPLFGLEIDPDIAAVANANLGGHVRVGDVLEANPADYPYVDTFHCSPPCTRASVANANATESELDIAFARKIVEFMRVLRPRNFTLENVRGYRKFKAFQIIMEGLRECGYQAKVHILDSANFGVPQNRIRLIVMASSSGMPRKPQATHQKRKDGQASLFETRLPNWIGWFESIIDLVPTLPESKFADWQLKRLPEELQSSLLINTAFPSSNGKKHFEAVAPAYTVDTQALSRTRAFIVEGSAAGNDNKFNMPVRAEGEPVFTMRAGQNNPRAFILDDQNGSKQPDGSRNVSMRDESEPVFTIPASETHTNSYRAFIVPGGNSTSFSIRNADEPARTVGDAERPGNAPRAFIVDGQETVPGKDGRVEATRPSDAPYLTVSATVYKGMPKAHIDQGRVVQMTPRALARFMSCPDWYELPESHKLACKLLGNGWPCLMAQRIFEAYK